MIAKVKACLQVEVEYSLFLAAYFAILEHQSKIESLLMDGYSVINSLSHYLIFFIIVLESRTQLKSNLQLVVPKICQIWIHNAMHEKGAMMLLIR